ncbi:hypothetical protein B484DRAFT_408102 [Ochromonadaceae sp. CCMP2298]|nr:hypothetical protein B484DRAFT_408102 [Ochromonadaceae sp. CCMP2298]
MMGYDGDGGPATSAKIERPATIYVDNANNKLYFTEEEACRLRGVSLTTNVISTISGDGTCLFTGDGGLATSAQLKKPRGLWLDPNSNIYIGTEDSCVVRRIDAITGIITTFAGTGSVLAAVKAALKPAHEQADIAAVK